MKIAVTGATGFLGRYLVEQLAGVGHSLRCWHRPSSDLGGFEAHAEAIEWVPGALGEGEEELVAGCDAVVHAGLDRPGAGFRGAEGDLVTFAKDNVLGTLKLIVAARSAGVERFVDISSCSVHDVILDDRPLDETHPTWSTSVYGAHKGAIEQFIYAIGLGEGYPICALRPCGIYGLARPAEASKWFELIGKVARGETVQCTGGGKEVHAADVARASELLLSAEANRIAGQAFNCCDRYVSDYDVAHLAQEISGSSATINGSQTRPKHEIDTTKLRRLGFGFGGEQRLRETIEQLVAR